MCFKTFPRPSLTAGPATAPMPFAAAISCSCPASRRSTRTAAWLARATWRRSAARRARTSRGCCGTTHLALANVASLTVYLRDINDRSKIEPVQRAYFGSVRPARTVCGVAAFVVPGALIELQAVAYKPGSAKLIP